MPKKDWIYFESIEDADKKRWFCHACCINYRIPLIGEPWEVSANSRCYRCGKTRAEQYG